MHNIVILDSDSLGDSFEVFEFNEIGHVTQYGTTLPQDIEERIKQITQNAQKFIYMVAYAGITGSGQKEDLTTVINNVRKHSSTPLYIGFGVDENTCKEKIIGVDGVIVGSAFVKHIIDDSLSNDEKIKKISAIAKEIKEKINE